jgi:hypothetical protein
MNLVFGSVLTGGELWTHGINGCVKNGICRVDKQRPYNRGVSCLYGRCWLKYRALNFGILSNITVLVYFISNTASSMPALTFISDTLIFMGIGKTPVVLLACGNLIPLTAL